MALDKVMGAERLSLCLVAHHAEHGGGPIGPRVAEAAGRQAPVCVGLHVDRADLEEVAAPGLVVKARWAGAGPKVPPYRGRGPVAGQEVHQVVPVPPAEAPQDRH